MEGARDNSTGLFRVENIAIGDRASRLSFSILVLAWAIPIIGTIVFGAVDTMTWVFIAILTAVTVLLWLVDAWLGKGILLDTSSLQLPLIALLALGVFQLAAGMSFDAFATRICLVRLAVYIIFFATCLTFINNERRMKATSLMVVVFGTLMAFFGILQRLANPDAIYGLRQTAQAIGFGPFVNQHHFAGFMEMTSGLAFGLIFGKRTAREKRILFAISGVLMGIAVMFTSSRGGVIGFVSVLGFVALMNFFSGRWSEKKRGKEPTRDVQQKFVVAAAGVAILLIIFGSVIFLGGNESLFRGLGLTEIQDGVTNGRAHFWPIAFRIFLEHPIVGAGLDAFGVAFTPHDSWNGFLRVEQAHNDYLQTLADAGLAGFACVTAFIYLLFRKGLKTVSKSRGFRRNAAIGALAGCFGILIHSFFDFPLRTHSNAFFFLMLCAIATVSISSREKKKATSA
jgi:O-antigen ligase